ncbi:unnamed protein product [Parnassius apollo]|uniref:(apollo) hypothetical protein n=1 Tax=Parnassius apollo TaxID=110799 RepID=A0A8S3W1K8_PARAO|nr:unnamed protein product [Parnassius apollo]
MCNKSIIVTTLLVVFCTSVIESVSFIKKCKSDDSKCIKESAQAAIPTFASGLPEYGVKSLDPFTFEKIDASTSSLELILTDITVKGLKNCIAKKIKRDKTKSKLFIKLLCSADLDGQYKMKGHLLFLSLEGNDAVHVKLRQAEINVEVDLEAQDNKWNIKHWQHSFNLKGKSEVIFENLFSGNKDLAGAAQEVIAQSGNDIIYEVGPPVIKAVIDQVVKTISNFFHAVPADELSID